MFVYILIVVKSIDSTVYEFVNNLEGNVFYTILIFEKLIECEITI